MKAIYKYPISVAALEADSSMELRMKAGAIPLAVQMQDEMLCLWAEVEDTMWTVRRRAFVVGTGTLWTVADTAQYVGTVQLFDGKVVLHVYLDTYEAL